MRTTSSRAARTAYPSVLFFRGAEEFQRELDLAGFTDVAWTGDWHGTPADDRSRILVF